jgi:hypothetical protein
MPISYAVRQEDNQHALCGSDFTSPIRALVLGLVFYTPSAQDVNRVPVLCEIAACEICILFAKPASRHSGF